GHLTRRSPEGAMGIVDPDGTFRLGTTVLYSRDATVQSTYTGRFSGAGGIITGTQVWTRVPAGRSSVSRTCHGTFVKVEPPVKLFDGLYKGSWVCEQSGIGVLRTWLVLVAQEGVVLAAAPLLDIDGREKSQLEPARFEDGESRLAREAASGT